MKKYLLSTGSSTIKFEKYILDVIRLNFSILPNEIPGNTTFGFDYIINNVKETELVRTIQNRVGSLISRISDRHGVKITLDSVELLDKKTAKVTVTVNNIESETFELDI